MASAPSTWDFVGEQIRNSAEQLRKDARRDVARKMLLSGQLGPDASTEPILIGVGHSLGGAGCVLAELQSPAGLFDQLLVWEPILFNPDPQAKKKRQAGGPDKAKSSRRRRATFNSPQQALDSFVQKPLFANWDSRSLHGYIDGGLRPIEHRNDASGCGWTLCCPPEVCASVPRYGSAARKLMIMVLIKCRSKLGTSLQESPRSDGRPSITGGARPAQLVWYALTRFELASS